MKRNVFCIILAITFPCVLLGNETLKSIEEALLSLDFERSSTGIYRWYWQDGDAGMDAVFASNPDAKMPPHAKRTCSITETKGTYQRSGKRWFYRIAELYSDESITRLVRNAGACFDGNDTKVVSYSLNANSLEEALGLTDVTREYGSNGSALELEPTLTPEGVVVASMGLRDVKIPFTNSFQEGLKKLISGGAVVERNPGSGRMTLKCQLGSREQLIEFDPEQGYLPVYSLSLQQKGFSAKGWAKYSKFGDGKWYVDEVILEVYHKVGDQTRTLNSTLYKTIKPEKLASDDVKTFQLDNLPNVE